MKVNNEPSTNKLLIYEFLKAFSLIFIEMDESFIHLSFKFHSTKKKKKKIGIKILKEIQILLIQNNFLLISK